MVVYYKPGAMTGPYVIIYNDKDITYNSDSTHTQSLTTRQYY